MKIVDLLAWLGKIVLTMLSIWIFTLAHLVTGYALPFLFLIPISMVFIIGYSIRGFFWGLLVTGVGAAFGFLSFFGAGMPFTIFESTREVLVSGSFAFGIAIITGWGFYILKFKGEEHRVSVANNILSGVVQFLATWLLLYDAILCMARSGFRL